MRPGLVVDQQCVLHLDLEGPDYVVAPTTNEHGAGGQLAARTGSPFSNARAVADQLTAIGETEASRFARFDPEGLASGPVEEPGGR
jgi:hypothetical protein